MDITSLLKLTPASPGTGNGTGRTATGETTARFADTLQAAAASARSAEASGAALQPAAGRVPGGLAALTSPLTAGGLLQQLAQGAGNPALAAPLNTAAIADAEPMETDWRDTELALGESGETVGLPAMALLSIAPPAMPSAETASTQTALAAQSGIASPLPAAVQEAIGKGTERGTEKGADKAAAGLDQALVSAGRAPSAQSIAGDSITATTGTGAAGPLLAEAAHTTAAESLPVMPATSSATTPAASPSLPATPALAMQSALGSAAWGDEFGQHLLNMVHRGEQQVDLYLHPRELGALSVSLSLDEQGARAQFFSAHGAVRSAVEQALPQLREALAQQGISLGEASVGDDRQPAFQQQLASGQHGDGSARANGSADPFDNIAPGHGEDTPVAAPVSSRAIDFYA